MRGDLAPRRALVGARPQLAVARPERDPDRVEAVDRHRLAEDAEVGVLLGQPGGEPLPGRPPVAGPPDRGGGVEHEPPALGRRERDHPGRGRVARVGDHREAEVRREAARDLRPRRAAVVGAVDAAVVLLVERLGLAGRRHELVDALAELRRRPGDEVGADAAVPRLPRRPAVARLERPDGRDPDPHPPRVGRVRARSCGG